MFIILLILGFILLFFGADWLVEGSKDIANRLNIPTIVIGLTLSFCASALNFTKPNTPKSAEFDVKF